MTTVLSLRLAEIDEVDAVMRLVGDCIAHMRQAGIEQWDDILRFVATIKLKETTASQLFQRLNSYAK